MRHEQNQVRPTSATAMTGHLPLIDDGSKAMPPSDLAKLLVRCRDDLILMDSVLSELEETGESYNDEGASFFDRIDSAESIAPPHLPNNKIAALGAASVHRMANDIEELYRSANNGDVQMMLKSLQTKMAHCLKLLPASPKQLSRQTSGIIE